MEQVYPAPERKKNIRITILPKGPVVANHDIVPVHRDQKKNNPYHCIGAKSENVAKAADQKTESHVTFSDQLLNRDAELHLNPINTETHDTMSTTVESFVPDAKVMARIQEKHELQDINDRFSQYLQVLQFSKVFNYSFAVKLIKIFLLLFLHLNI